MKKILKWLMIVIIVILIALFAAVKIMSKDIPTGESGPAAEALSQKILDRMNKPAWDSLQYISWTFFGGSHHYIWNRKVNSAAIKWEDYNVYMDLNNLEATITKGDKLVIDPSEHEKIKQKAWGYWCNDSFWLYAPYKLRDKGIKRSLIEEDGKQGLLVTYASGGATPGDSYLWWVDETGLPTSYDMWTSIIPIKGLNATWSNWETLPGGSMVATSHKIGPKEMSISNVKAGPTLESIGSSNKEFSGPK